MRIATYNIRISNLSDWGFKFWLTRRHGVADIIKSYDIDIMGVQEVANLYQKFTLMSLLDDYRYYGMGRNSLNGFLGEQTGILYKPSKFSIIKKGSYFLSETPEIESKGWDAAYKRRTVWAQFFDRESYRNFYVFNTHLDSGGIEAREKSILLNISKIEEIVPNENTPVFLLGDFNITCEATPDLYRKLYELTPPMLDANLFSSIKVNNEVGTWNGFLDEIPDITRRMDYIFTKNVQMNKCETSLHKHRGHYPSDHCPVILTCELGHPL